MNWKSLLLGLILCIVWGFPGIAQIQPLTGELIFSWQATPHMPAPELNSSFAVRKIFPGIFHVHFDKGLDADSVVGELAVMRGVKHVQFNYPIVQRNDPLLATQWQYQNAGQGLALVDADIDAQEAWAITTGGQTYWGEHPAVAVLDFGFRLDHEDWQENQWTNEREIPNNQIDDDGNGFVDDVYGWNFQLESGDVTQEGLGNFHGTPVCGIIGADGGNGIGVCGVNWATRIIPIVIRQDIAGIIEGYHYAYQLRKQYDESGGKEGAFVLSTNASLGVEFLFPGDAPIWCEIYDVLGESGILSVASAPNNAIDVDEWGDLPSTCQSDFLLSVTNTNKQDKLDAQAGYSSQSVDMSAPGSGVFTLLNNGGYGLFGGTSAASPHVAGAVALLYTLPVAEMEAKWNENPAELALIIKQALLNGVDKLPSLAGKTVSEGRLNLAGAMQALCEELGCSLPVRSPLAWQVYPNPAREDLTLVFEFESPSGIEVEILTMQGQIKHHYVESHIPAGIQRIVLDLPPLAPACYILRYRHPEDNWASKKLVVE
ncbi:MAG: S8 family peptidase [Bacteroidota bacterium]